MTDRFADNITNQRCFLCRRGAKISPGNDGYFVGCKTCDKYHVVGTMLASIKNNEVELLPYLSIYTRQANERGEKVLWNSENWKAKALACQQTPLSVKVDKLLKLAASRSKPGHPAKFDPHSDPPLVYACDPNELGFLLQHLKELGYADAAHDWTVLLKGKAWHDLQSTKTQGGVQTQHPSGHYVDATRIEELKSLEGKSFDFSKLIRMCEELNICFAEGCYLAVAMLVRSVLDHVPPIFGCNGFAEVANNYNGSKSFKESMVHLENSSRKIADSHLHQRIRSSESLPNKTQVNFTNDIDVLLAEIIRILR